MSAQSAAKTTTNRAPSTSKERGRTVGTLVRTTFEPGKVLEVGDAELVDLSRQSLLHSFERSDHTDEQGLGKSPKPWKSGKPEEVDSGVITDAAADSDETEGVDK